jgi:hypothetical protein
MHTNFLGSQQVREARTACSFSKRSRYCESGYHWLCLVVLGVKGYIIAGLVEGVVDFALHCMAGMDGIPGFSYERVVRWVLGIIAGSKRGDSG